MEKSGKLIKNSIIILLLIFLTVMLVYSSYLLLSYRAGLVDEAESMALSTSLDCIAEMNAKVDTALRQSKEIALSASGMLTNDEMLRYFNTVTSTLDSDIALLRFFNDGIEYDSRGYTLEGGEDPAVTRLERSRTAGCTGLIYDHNIYTSMAYIAFYVPVENSTLIDGIVTYCMITELFGDLVAYGTAAVERSEYLCLCAKDGTIIFELQSDAFPSNELTNIYTSLRALTNDKPAVDELRRIVETDGTGSCSFTIDSDEYSLAVACAPSSDNTLYLADIYRASSLYGTGYSFVANISVALLILLVILSGGFAYLMYLRRAAIDKIRSYDNIDPVLQCNTYKKFSLDTEQILEHNKVTKFALIYTEVEQFRFIIDSYDSLTADDILHYIAKVFNTSLQQSETYGHISEDKFVMLMHYSDENDLINRLKVIYAVVFNYPEMKKLNSNLRLSVGVYCIDRANDREIQKMLDRAIIAQKTNTLNTSEAINIYTEKVKTTFMREAEIESRKEMSLANNEFRVFYQPKYNIKYNRPDGAEALVRWYDPDTNTFRNPAEFVPIFEANGFIGKVDRYVYTEVCKYITESVERGYKIVPVSVNVSRVTATQEGFVDFYVRTKKKYNIADGFLTIEFTESFAFENYDALKDMVGKFQSNGIHCSIDDFGSGYSSYNILKELQMDELKLDRFFINKGFSPERDDELLRTIITLAKHFGMKVTQEGVETVDVLERLERFGCDVVQGYYYSKPLALDDYIAFINHGGSIDRY